MPIKFIDDGQPEAAEFDENYTELLPGRPKGPLPEQRQREWRELELPAATTVHFRRRRVPQRPA